MERMLTSDSQMQIENERRSQSRKVLAIWGIILLLLSPILIIPGVQVFSSSEYLIAKADATKYTWNARDAQLNAIGSSGIFKSSWNNLADGWTSHANRVNDEVRKMELGGYIRIALGAVTFIASMICFSKRSSIPKPNTYY